MRIMKQWYLEEEKKFNKFVYPCLKEEKERKKLEKYAPTGNSVSVIVCSLIIAGNGQIEEGKKVKWISVSFYFLPFELGPCFSVPPPPRVLIQLGIFVSKEMYHIIIH